MLRRALAPTLVLTLVGCGGRETSSPTPAATSAERMVAATALTRLGSALSYDREALQFNPLAGVSTGLDEALPPDVDDPLGGVPENPIPTFYLNAEIGAWEQVTDTNTAHREDYYLDEAKTQPAGYDLVTGSVDASGTITSTEHYEFSAGTYAGAHGDTTEIANDVSDATSDDSLWSSVYTQVAVDGAVYKGAFAYKGLALTAAGTTTYPDGKADTFSAKFDAGGAGPLTFVSREGVKLTANFDKNDGAKGSLTGDASGLPASFISTDSVVKVQFRGGGTTTFSPLTNASVRAKRKDSRLSHRARLQAAGRR